MRTGDRTRYSAPFIFSPGEDAAFARQDGSVSRGTVIKVMIAITEGVREVKYVFGGSDVIPEDRVGATLEEAWQLGQVAKQAAEKQAAAEAAKLGAAIKRCNDSLARRRERFAGAPDASRGDSWTSPARPYGY